MRVTTKTTIDVSGDSLSDLIDTLTKLRDMDTGGSATVDVNSYEIEVTYEIDL